MNKKEGEIVRQILKGEEFQDKTGLWATKYFPAKEGESAQWAMPASLRALLRDDDPDYVVLSHMHPLAWHIPAMERWKRDEKLGHQVVFMVPEQWRTMNESRGAPKHVEIVQTALALAVEATLSGYADSDY